MKLLLITQKVDKNDSDLGFFHAWIEKIATQVDHLIVICLQKGEYELPENVKVLSLGKERGVSRISYLLSFYQYIFKYRKEYDAVFIHMNPEYAILGGPLWRMMGKKVLLWYTHKSVDWRLRLAEKFVTKIFTASKESFRLPSRKVEIVGHGIDVEKIPVMQSMGDQIKLLSVGRIASSKDLETIILGVAELSRGHVLSPPAGGGALAEAGRGGGSTQHITLDIIGEPITDADREYEKTLRELAEKLGLEDKVRFLGGMPHSVLLGEYAKHQILIHTSKTGSLDKVVLEALSAGLHVVSSSEAYGDFGDLVHHFPANDSKKLALCIEKVIDSGILSPNEEGRKFVEEQYNLDSLIRRLMDYFVISSEA